MEKEKGKEKAKDYSPDAPSVIDPSGEKFLVTIEDDNFGGFTNVLLDVDEIKAVPIVVGAFPDFYDTDFARKILFEILKIPASNLLKVYEVHSMKWKQFHIVLIYSVIPYFFIDCFLRGEYFFNIGNLPLNWHSLLRKFSLAPPCRTCSMQIGCPPQKCYLFFPPPELPFMKDHTDVVAPDIIPLAPSMINVPMPILQTKKKPKNKVEVTVEYDSILLDVEDMRKFPIVISSFSPLLSCEEVKTILFDLLDFPMVRPWKWFKVTSSVTKRFSVVIIYSSLPFFFINGLKDKRNQSFGIFKLKWELIPRDFSYAPLCDQCLQQIGCTSKRCLWSNPPSKFRSSNSGSVDILLSDLTELPSSARIYRRRSLPKPNLILGYRIDEPCYKKPGLSRGKRLSTPSLSFPSESNNLVGIIEDTQSLQFRWSKVCINQEGLRKLDIIIVKPELLKRTLLEGAKGKVFWCTNAMIAPDKSDVGFVASSTWGVVEIKEAMKEEGKWVDLVKEYEGMKEAVRRAAEWYEQKTIPSPSDSTLSSSSKTSGVNLRKRVQSYNALKEVLHSSILLLFYSLLFLSVGNDLPNLL